MKYAHLKTTWIHEIKETDIDRSLKTLKSPKEQLKLLQKSS